MIEKTTEVFLSYIYDEEDMAAAVQTFLKENFDGLKVFMSGDKWQVYAGEDWFARIRQELISAGIVILMLSQKSVVRPWVNFEAGAAWFGNKHIIPVCFGDISKENLPAQFSPKMALHLPEDDYYLLTSVAHHLGNTFAPVPGSDELQRSSIRLRTTISRLMGVNA